MHIESTLPLWLVLPLVALAIFVVWFLYFRKQQDAVLPKPFRVLLSISRLLVLIIIGLLIISPWIRTSVTRQTQPWFIIARDNSISVPPEKDHDGFIKNQDAIRNKLTENLEPRFKVKEVVFGSMTADGNKLTYTDPLTDPGELFTYMRIFARTHDLAGVLITTDGVATRGVNFAEAAADFPYPVSVLASGDSTRFPDVRIQDVVSNEWTRKNSLFPVRVYYNTGDYKGSGLIVRISGPNGAITEKAVQTASQSSPYVEFILQAPEKGVMQLVATIIPDTPDKNTDNNSKRFTVKIIEQEGEILCLYESPHPDIDAIVLALKGTSTLNVTVMNVSDFKPGDKNYDMVILHGLPSLKHPSVELLQWTIQKQVPVLLIIGKSTDPSYFNQAGLGMLINNRRRMEEAARGVMEQQFSLFSLPEDFFAHVNTWPPLSLSFETYNPDPGSQVFMRQKILNIEINDPLVAFSSTRGIKYGFFCGEGIWLWRLHEFLEQKNHDYFDELISRSVQYLLADEKMERFRITIPEELYAYSPVRINGHLLDNSLEEINEPEVQFNVTDSAGLQTAYTMGKVNDYYELNINGFGPGTYHYTAETGLGKETFRKEGQMTMLVRPVEQTGPVADFESLRAVAAGTGGRFFAPRQDEDLVSYLKNIKPSEAKIKQEFKWYDLINFKLLLPLLILLLSMEWFLRRWFGIR